MKYIRTRDGIYSYEPTHNIDVDGFVIQHSPTGWDKPIMKEDIIKITDTIEELCDEFVLFRDNKPYVMVPNKGHNAELAKDVWKDYRGAIWTEWGLKYVAKVNEKGELCLL